MSKGGVVNAFNRLGRKIGVIELQDDWKCGDIVSVNGRNAVINSCDNWNSTNDRWMDIFVEWLDN